MRIEGATIAISAMYLELPEAAEVQNILSNTTYAAQWVRGPPQVPMEVLPFSLGQRWVWLDIGLDKFPSNIPLKYKGKLKVEARAGLS